MSTFQIILHEEKSNSPLFPKPWAVFTNGLGHAKMCLMPYANTKGTDQPAHPRSLISAFVFVA